MKLGQKFQNLPIEFVEPLPEESTPSSVRRADCKTFLQSTKKKRKKENKKIEIFLLSFILSPSQWHRPAWFLWGNWERYDFYFFGLFFCRIKTYRCQCYLENLVEFWGTLLEVCELFLSSGGIWGGEDTPVWTAGASTMTKPYGQQTTTNYEDVNPFRKKKEQRRQRRIDEAQKGVWSASAVNFYSTSLYFCVLSCVLVDAFRSITHICMHMLYTLQSN